jgi:hypothetical protein
MKRFNTIEGKKIRKINFLNIKRIVNTSILAILFSLLVAFPIYSQNKYMNWESKLKSSLNSFRLDSIKKFFDSDFALEELESWKYKIEDGFLSYDSTKIIKLSENTILLYIPTNNKPYSGNNADVYFDFIYRIYEITPKGEEFIITKRVMDDFNPDFVKTKSEIKFLPEESTCLIKSKTTVKLKTNHLIFKLAKEFDIDEFLIDDKPAHHRRLDYLIYAPVDDRDSISFSIKGKIKAPNDHNQFFCIDGKNIFIRLGGFPVIPSPPPDNTGRYNFSKDTTEFDFTYIFPQEFKFIQYGTVYSEYSSEGNQIVSAKSKDEWMDNLAFYSQKDWMVKYKNSGNAKLSFYLPQNDSNTFKLLTSAINKLLDWSFSIFNAYPKSEINFIVLDKFVENGALNDSRSIITQNTETILEDTYIHEILHTVPQPKLKNDFLWIKEGFTNFLSFNYLDFKDNKKEFWIKQKRYYINAYNQFTEPLSALTSTSMPTYWTAYQKGPWVYRMIESIIGEDNFKKAMLQFVKMNNQVLADTREYFSIFENISGKDLSRFEDQWLNRKENPVLRIENSISSIGNKEQVNIKIVQEGKLFKYPLDVEIITKKNVIHKVIWVDSAENEFVFPIDSKLITINYDPDAKLFAVIKTGKTSFLEKNKLNIPSEEKVYKFVSSKNKSEVEYKIVPDNYVITLIKKCNNIVSTLELDNSLSPLKLLNNNKIVFKNDYSSGKVIFDDVAFDVSEPVYTQEHILMLFLCVDWTLTTEESFLFLGSNKKWCAGSYAKCEKISEEEIKLTIDNYFNTYELFIKNGVPIKYIVDKEETYNLIK